MKEYDVFGIGNALMDIQVFVPEKLLKKLKIPKGIMNLIDEEESKNILKNITQYKPASSPGGSCANTMAIVAKLGGTPVYSGVVSDDMYGRLYKSLLGRQGVKVLIKTKPDGLTGTSIVLTTEDAERTMNTHLGACRDFSKGDIKLDYLSNSKIFHCTGYQWDTPSQKEAIEFAMDYAKNTGLAVSFDIADPFCIDRNVEDFKNIISKYVTILFGNQEEAKILSGEEDPIEAGKKIKKMGPDIVIIKVGSKGSYIFYDNKVDKVDIYKPEQVLDSTGCGDSYAGGFLYGYSNDYDIVKCGKIASYIASRIVGIPGVKLEMLKFDEIKTFIDDNIVK